MTAGRESARKVGDEFGDQAGEHRGPPLVERLSRQGARPVEVLVDGAVVPCFEGETVATALLTRRSWIAFDGRRRHAVLCGIGVCCECVVAVDGRAGVRACLTPVRDGMRISTVPAVTAPARGEAQTTP